MIIFSELGAGSRSITTSGSRFARVRDAWLLQKNETLPLETCSRVPSCLHGLLDLRMDGKNLGLSPREIYCVSMSTLPV